MSTLEVASHHSGFVAVVGRPSTGKSTLINAYLGQLVAPVSPRAQTTRQRQLGILTLPDSQMIFVDTPGVHRPHDRLGERMNSSVREALDDCDLALLVFDLHEGPGEDDATTTALARTFAAGRPIFLALNKLDLVAPSDWSERASAFCALAPEAEAWAVSATRGDHCADLLSRLLASLPEGPQYYPPEDLTDAHERDLAAELIRASAMHLLHGEIPHSLAVRVHEYRERDDGGAYISAMVYVERESQKAIVIGHGGRMIRQLGTLARRQIESMSGRKVYLDLRVKVMPGWRENEDALRQFGYGNRPR